VTQRAHRKEMAQARRVFEAQVQAQSPFGGAGALKMPAVQPMTLPEEKMEDVGSEDDHVVQTVLGGEPKGDEFILQDPPHIRQRKDLRLAANADAEHPEDEHERVTDADTTVGCPSDSTPESASVMAVGSVIAASTVTAPMAQKSSGEVTLQDQHS